MWVVSEVGEDQKLYWRADSDSELTKVGYNPRSLKLLEIHLIAVPGKKISTGRLPGQGLAALLVKGLSGCSAEEIVSVEASDVIDALGLSASLTPSRSNGFLNMFRLMQKKALLHLTAQVKLVLSGATWWAMQIRYLLIMNLCHMPPRFLTQCEL